MGPVPAARLAEWVARLVAFPSVSPTMPARGPGRRARLRSRTLSPMARVLRRRDRAARRAAGPRERARQVRRPDHRIVVLDVHVDTVGVEQMTGDPFDGRIEDGRVYGRGAVDTKASLASRSPCSRRCTKRRTTRADGSHRLHGGGGCQPLRRLRLRPPRTGERARDRRAARCRADRLPAGLRAQGSGTPALHGRGGRGAHRAAPPRPQRDLRGRPHRRGDRRRQRRLQEPGAVPGASGHLGAPTLGADADRGLRASTLSPTARASQSTVVSSTPRTRLRSRRRSRPSPATPRRCRSRSRRCSPRPHSSRRPTRRSCSASPSCRGRAGDGHVRTNAFAYGGLPAPARPLNRADPPGARRRRVGGDRPAGPPGGDLPRLVGELPRRGA